MLQGAEQVLGVTSSQQLQQMVMSETCEIPMNSGVDKSLKL